MIPDDDDRSEKREHVQGIEIAARGRREGSPFFHETEEINFPRC